MADRLTQLQVCLDQLLEQFCATINYVNTNHDYVPAENEEKMTDKDANVAAPPSSPEFLETMGELSTDLILKTRQIFTIIESLPGKGVSADDQFKTIEKLQGELLDVEKKRKEAIAQKDDLVEWCNDLITTVGSEIIKSTSM